MYKAKLRPAENDPRYGIKCGVTKNVSATILMFEQTFINVKTKKYARPLQHTYFESWVRQNSLGTVLEKNSCRKFSCMESFKKNHFLVNFVIHTIKLIYRVRHRPST